MRGLWKRDERDGDDDASTDDEGPTAGPSRPSDSDVTGQPDDSKADRDDNDGPSLKKGRLC